MFTSYVFLLCGLAFTAEAYAQGRHGKVERNRVELDDFNEVARQYVMQIGNKYGKEVKWWDLYGKHEHLAQRPEYSKYKIKVWSDIVKYGEVQKTVERPGYVYTQWFHNAQSVPVVAEFTREVTLHSKYTWSMSKSIKINAEIKATAGIPDVLGVNAFFNSSVDLQEQASQTTEEKEVYSVKNIITVLPKRSVKAEFIVTEKDVEVPWEADVQIEGWVAMWFKEKYDGHWLWFHPVKAMANDKFRLTDDSERLFYRASGNFRGLRGVDTTLKTYEYELIESADPHLQKPAIRIQTLKPNIRRLH